MSRRAARSSRGRSSRVSARRSASRAPAIEARRRAALDARDFGRRRRARGRDLRRLGRRRRARRVAAAGEPDRLDLPRASVARARPQRRRAYALRRARRTDGRLPGGLAAWAAWYSANVVRRVLRRRSSSPPAVPGRTPADAALAARALGRRVPDRALRRGAALDAGRARRVPAVTNPVGVDGSAGRRRSARRRSRSSSLGARRRRPSRSCSASAARAASSGSSSSVLMAARVVATALFVAARPSRASSAPRPRIALTLLGVLAHPGRDRRRDAALPAVRDRPRDLADARLRRADGDPRRGVRRARARGAGGVLVVRGRLGPRDRRLDARGRGALPAAALARAALRRPPLLPPPLRRAAHARSVRRAAARAGRPRDAARRPARRRRGDDAAGARRRSGSGASAREPRAASVGSPGARGARVALTVAALRRSSGSRRRPATRTIVGRRVSRSSSSSSPRSSARSSPRASRRTRSAGSSSRIGARARASARGGYATTSLLARARACCRRRVAAWFASWSGLLDFCSSRSFRAAALPDRAAPARRWRPCSGRASAGGPADRDRRGARPGPARGRAPAVDEPARGSTRGRAMRSPARASASCLLVRARRRRSRRSSCVSAARAGVERQQLKWFARRRASLARLHVVVADDVARSLAALATRVLLAIVAHPGRDRRRDPALPAVRRRPRDLADARLRRR